MYLRDMAITKSKINILKDQKQNKNTNSMCGLIHRPSEFQVRTQAEMAVYSAPEEQSEWENRARFSVWNRKPGQGTYGLRQITSCYLEGWEKAQIVAPPKLGQVPTSLITFP